MLKRPLLPEGRYWPAAAFAAFVAIAALGWSSAPRANNQPRDTAKQEIGDPIAEAVSLIAGAKSDQWIALFTGLTGIIFFFQLLAMRRQNEHFRVTERAYVRMSHVSNMRTALQWSKEPDSGKFDVLIEVKNCGRTPGRITAVWLTCKAVAKGKELPIDFSYGDEPLSYDSGKGYTFLMPSDSFYLPQGGKIHEADRRAVDAGESTLIVFGYVDYIDQFEAHHRAGYGRQYIPNVAGNNLGFPVVRAKLNYDEVRGAQVGWDWNQ